MLDGVFYLVRSGCAWRMLPHEYPPWQTVYHRARARHRDGTWRRLDALLRGRVRQREGRHEQPSGGSFDSQSVRTSGMGGPDCGSDGAQRLSGRKRHLLVDTTGLVLHARIHSAALHDRDGGRLLLDATSREELPRLDVVWADQGYAGAFARWAREERGYRLTVTYHRGRHLWHYGMEERPKGFVVVPRRWVPPLIDGGERTFGWLGPARRLAKGYERRPPTGEAMIYAAMARLVLRRLARSDA